MIGNNNLAAGERVAGSVLYTPDLGGFTTTNGAGNLFNPSPAEYSNVPGRRLRGFVC